MLKKLLGVALALMALEGMAYPTSAQIAKARPLVVALMADDVAAEKANRKTAEAVGDAALALVPKASGEAAKLQLFEGAFQYYVRGRAYGKAAQTIKRMRSDISDFEPENIVELVRSNAKGVRGKEAPELLALYRTARFQVTMQETLSKTRIALRKTPNDKDLVRKLGEAQALSGDWKSALETFARFKGGAGIHARAEKNGRNLFEAANFWWNYESFAGTDGTAIFRGHAVALYRQTLEGGELDGLRKEVAEKRIKTAVVTEQVAHLRPLPKNMKKTLSEVMSPTVPKGLAHRWSFNEDLHDSVGGVEAFTGGNARLENGQCVLNQGWITINGAAASFNGDFTLEIWTTENQRAYGSRVFRLRTPTTPNGTALFGWATGCKSEGFFHCDGYKLIWHPKGFALGVETYVAVTCKAEGGHCVVTAYLYDNKEKKLRFHSEHMDKNHISSVSYFDLGARICISRDFINAISSFNECRVWKRCLTKEEILHSVKSGPDDVER